MDLTDGNPTTSNIVQSSFNELAEQFGHGHILFLGLTLNECLKFFVNSDSDSWIFDCHLVNLATSSASCASSKHSAHVPSAFMRLASQWSAQTMLPWLSVYVSVVITTPQLLFVNQELTTVHWLSWLSQELLVSVVRSLAMLQDCLLELLTCWWFLWLT